MANPTTIGYLLSFDSTVIVDISAPTALRAIGVVQNSATANVRTYVLPSGVKVNYDGVGDSSTTPGSMSQSILCTAGGLTLYATLAAKLGHYGTAVLSPLSGADISAAAILTGVEDITPGLKHDGDVHIRVTIDIIGDWT